MTKFRVIKMGFVEICGGDLIMDIEGACAEILEHRGWDSLGQLRASIKTWAKVAKPGDIFRTQRSVVVACKGRR